MIIITRYVNYFLEKNVSSFKIDMTILDLRQIIIICHLFIRLFIFANLYKNACILMNPIFVCFR